MNSVQRNKNRATAKELNMLVRKKELLKHICYNCGKPGGHWVTTRPISLMGILANVDDSEGFWVCNSTDKKE